jgi:phosphoribosylanthranilate isomerase
MTRIKICGITNPEDALLASQLGADALGFVFAESPRRIEPQTAREIIGALPPFIGRVGIFVNERPEVVERICALCNLSAIQLHGDESPEYINSLSIPVIKAFRVRDNTALEQIRAFRQSYFLLDAYDADRRGGTGKTFDWDIAQRASELGNLILSGGLNSKNVQDALDRVRPYAVDVSSGIEDRPGKKNQQKLTEFIHEVKSWDSRTN